MTFEEKYKKIKDVVAQDLISLEQGINNIFNDESSEKTALDNDLSDFLIAPSKRLRPLLGFLFLRSIFNKITPEQKDILLAVELIHSATLIHDDVIDKADKRRNKQTLNIKFDDNLAVIAGDFLLSIALEKVINTGALGVLKFFTSTLKATCIGEINQYFNKFEVPTIDEYIEKSKKKTALLFKMGIIGSLLLEKESFNKNLNNAAEIFSENFGIAFQIRDDLINLLNSDKLEINDLNSGIYTAPVIFARQENENLFNEENILAAIKNTKGIEKTKILIDNYFDKSISAIEEFEENTYKKTILELIDLLKNQL